MARTGATIRPATNNPDTNNPGTTHPDTTHPGAGPHAIRSGPRSLIWLQGLLCGGLATLATPTALLIGVLILPAIIASALDRQPGRPIARSIALFGLCGVVGPMLRLWAAGHTLDAAATLATELDSLLPAWGAAALGWLLAELAPVAVRAVLEAMALSRTARLRAERARYEAEWGFAPAAEQD